MQTIPLKEHQLLMSNLSSLSLHVHSCNDSLWSVTFAFSHPGEGLRTPTNNWSITPLKAETALDPIRLRQCWVKAKRELQVTLHMSKYHTIQILSLSRDLTEFGLALWSSLSPLKRQKAIWTIWNQSIVWSQPNFLIFPQCNKKRNSKTWTFEEKL